MGHGPILAVRFLRGWGLCRRHFCLAAGAAAQKSDCPYGHALAGAGDGRYRERWRVRFSRTAFARAVGGRRPGAGRARALGRVAG